MLDNLKKYKVILASNSPRRKELLSGLGIDYEVRTLPDVDESYPDTLQGGDIPLYIAREKAAAYRNLMQADELMITADRPHARSVYRRVHHDDRVAAQFLGSDRGALCTADGRRNRLVCRPLPTDGQGRRLWRAGVDWFRRRRVYFGQLFQYYGSACAAALS